MSKERELLKECRLILDTPFNGSTGINLRNRIAELLAQPEQEPVYWENEKKALLNEIDYLTNRLAQPELSTDSLQLDEQEPVAWMNDSGGCFLSDGNKYSENWTALYASPSKPERMTDDEISAVTAGHDPTPYGVHMFKMGIRWYEKYKSRVGVYDDSE